MDGNDNPVCETAKETQMYRAVFWTVGEEEGGMIWEMVGDGQGSLACYSPWGHRELNMTEQLNCSLLCKSL